ncbi:MAG: carboxy-S-adenosyl-L-methionine synthase CmoA [Gammaproteobacteria bacterium]|nr:carboxy-S-adenosyl-L-methionine synthase CmoA [Gammaproteobacteria bacterium]
MSNSSDDVYQHRQDQIVDFVFNQAVVDVFPDMIRRSVPGYETVIPMTGLIAARHAGAKGVVFDLGCSLGATTQAVLAHNSSPDLRIIGVDNAEAMIDGAQANNQDPRAQFVHSDIQDVDLTGANVVVLNFVLQFVPPDHRKSVLQKIHSGLAKDGLLIVSEKICHASPKMHTLFDETHLAWKKANGYSELEISQKRSALENVMQVDTEATHTQRLHSVGFSSNSQWYRCMNWASFLAWK